MTSVPVPADLPPESEQDKFMDMGGGISRELTLIPSAKDPENKAEPPLGAPEVISTDAWIDRPSVKDQAQKHPDTVRETSRTARVFDVSQTEDARVWNEWLQAVKEQRAVIHDTDRNFHEGKYFIYAVCSFLEYRRILPTRNEDG